MFLALRPFVIALAALFALAWSNGPAFALDPAPASVMANVAVAEQDSHHREGVAHCATGAGGGCVVPALCGGTAVLLFRPDGPRTALPVNKCGVALMKVGPPSPIPIG